MFVTKYNAEEEKQTIICLFDCSWQLKTLPGCPWVSLESQFPGYSHLTIQGLRAQGKETVVKLVSTEFNLKDY